MEESKLIWKNSVDLPDIVISLGSGFQVERTGDGRSAPSRASVLANLMPKGLRKNVSGLLDMVTATLHSDRDWKNYLQLQDPSFTSRCHRLDVGLSGKPPEIDQLDSMSKLDKEVARFLHSDNPSYTDPKYRNAHDHVKTIARKLLATLFYFVKNTEDSNQDEAREFGMLKCRLSPSMDMQFAALIAARPIFRTTETYEDESHSQAIEFMNTPDQWDLGSFSASISYWCSPRAEKRIIEVLFPTRSEEWEPIGGF